MTWAFLVKVGKIETMFLKLLIYSWPSVQVLIFLIFWSRHFSLNKQRRRRVISAGGQQSRMWYGRERYPQLRTSAWSTKDICVLIISIKYTTTKIINVEWEFLSRGRAYWTRWEAQKRTHEWKPETEGGMHRRHGISRKT